MIRILAIGLVVMAYGIVGIYFMKVLEESFESAFRSHGITYGWQNFVLAMLILLWPVFLAILTATTAYTAIERIGTIDD